MSSVQCINEHFATWEPAAVTSRLVVVLRSSLFSPETQPTDFTGAPRIIMNGLDTQLLILTPNGVTSVKKKKKDNKNVPVIITVNSTDRFAPFIPLGSETTTRDKKTSHVSCCFRATETEILN